MVAGHEKERHLERLQLGIELGPFLFQFGRVRRIARNEITHAHHEFGHDQVKLVYRIEKNARPHATGAIAHDRKLEVFRIVVEIKVGPRFQRGIDVALKLRRLRLRDHGGNEADGAYHPQRGNTTNGICVSMSL